MALKALLTVDLENNVTSEQRTKFNERLKELNWTKIVSLTTTWSASFNENVSVNSALSETKKDINTAANAGNISRYHCSVQFGEEGPFTF